MNPVPPADAGPQYRTDRRRWLAAAPAGLAALASAGLGGCAAWRGLPPDDAAHGQVVLPEVTPFSTATQRPWPVGWHPYVLRRDLPPTRYDLVRVDDRQVLRARARRSATGLHCAIQPAAAGRLQFSWRVGHTPPGASVDAAELDDCPARVIVAFDGDHQRLPLRDRLLFDKVELFTGQKLPFAMLMYVWGGQANAPESLHRNHRTSRIQYLTVESGAARAGRWLTYERDLAQDYQRAFGEAPGPVISVGVLTDADALKLDLEALYGDITLRPVG
jgi:Protein of unknown function (DUF3047)